MAGRSSLKAPERQSVSQLAALGEVQRANRGLYRAFLLKEELRAGDSPFEPTLVLERLADRLRAAGDPPVEICLAAGQQQRV